MNQILYNTTKTTDKKKTGIIALIVVICIILCVSTVFALINKNNDKIINNVFIAETNVSDKTKDEAISLLNSKISEYKAQELVLALDNAEYKISTEELGFDSENLEAIVEEAYNYGRDGNLLQNNYTILFSNFRNKNLDIEYKLDDNLFNEFISKVVNVNEEISSDDSYEISGDKIIITKGQAGKKVDLETLNNYILTAVKNSVDKVEIPLVDSTTNNIDFDKLYAEVYKEPQNASYISGEKFEVIVEKTGVDFDIEKAKADYDALEELGTMTVELRVKEAEVKVADLDSELFKDVLATYSTTYDQSEKNRVQNLSVASERCNSTIVYPGEEFSFHKTIGTRTIANGYASAHSFAGGKVVNSVGGGICQVSSTLYNIVLNADLEVTERTAHGMYVKYAKPSLDATISEGALDFKFKNNRNYPIKIESILKDGTLKMSILGIKEPTDKIIEIESVVLETLEYKTIEEKDSTMLSGTTKVVQEPVEGYVSEAYRIEKNASGEIISRTLISKDRYIPTDKIVKVGTKVITPVEPEKPVEPETPVTPVEPEIPEQTPIEEEPERDLPQGWDSPESPYGN